MKRILLFLFLSLSQLANSQLTVDTTITLDLLKAPSSPAFTILGIAPSDIERPTDLASFSLSLQQATNNFTALPRSYALQVAPFLLGNRKFTLNEFDSNRHTFKQSFLLSAGFTHQGPQGQEEVDSLKTSRLGLGLKFSVVRPRWSGETSKRYAALVAAQQQLLAEYQNRETQSTELLQKRKALQSLYLKEPKTETDQAQILSLIKEIQNLTEALGNDINNGLETSSDVYALLQKSAVEIKNERKGFFLDFAGGFALDFRDNRFDNSNVYRGGAWLTGGLEGGNNGLTYLFIARYLYNPETLFAAPNNSIQTTDLSTFDAGARLLLNAAKGKFTLSTEAVYRSVFNVPEINPSWRFILNTEYDVGINKKLTFSFGKDFDGTISTGGNVIAALNLILGFGGERSVSRTTK